MHFVYMVRCADDTLYTGYARDPKTREEAHNRGRGARYTSGRRPVALVYREAFTSKSAALRREYQLKRLNRVRKLALVRTTKTTKNTKDTKAHKGTKGTKGREM